MQPLEEVHAEASIPDEHTTQVQHDIIPLLAFTATQEDIISRIIEDVLPLEIVENGLDEHNSDSELVDCGNDVQPTSKEYCTFSFVEDCELTNAVVSGDSRTSPEEGTKCLKKRKKIHAPPNFAKRQTRTEGPLEEVNHILSKAKKQAAVRQKSTYFVNC